MFKRTASIFISARVIFGTFKRSSIDDQLLEAIKNQDQSLVEELLGAKANVNYEKKIPTANTHSGSSNRSRMFFNNIQTTPLHKAVELGHVDIVKVLLENGADFNKVNWHGMSPAQLAVMNGHPDIVKLLIEYRADISKVDSSKMLGSVSGDNRRQIEHILSQGKQQGITTMLDRHPATDSSEAAFAKLYPHLPLQL